MTNLFITKQNKIVESNEWQDDFKLRVIRRYSNTEYLTEDRQGELICYIKEDNKQNLKERCNVRDEEILEHLENFKPLTENESNIILSINGLFENKYDFLTILGSVGIGKTFTTCLTCFEKKKTSFYYTTEYELINSYYEKNFSSFYENLKEIPLLIIDEIGRTTFKDKTLFENLLSERYKRNKKTILISNKTPQEMQDYFDLYIFDRFFKSKKSKCISITGESLRRFF